MWQKKKKLESKAKLINDNSDNNNNKKQRIQHSETDRRIITSQTKFAHLMGDKRKHHSRSILE